MSGLKWLKVASVPLRRKLNLCSPWIASETSPVIGLKIKQMKAVYPVYISQQSVCWELWSPRQHLSPACLRRAVK